MDIIFNIAGKTLVLPKVLAVSSARKESDMFEVSKGENGSKLVNCFDVFVEGREKPFRFHDQSYFKLNSKRNDLIKAVKAFYRK